MRSLICISSFAGFSPPTLEKNKAPGYLKTFSHTSLSIIAVQSVHLASLANKHQLSMRRIKVALLSHAARPKLQLKEAKTLKAGAIVFRSSAISSDTFRIRP